MTGAFNQIQTITTGERNYFTAQNQYGGEKKITFTDYLLLCKCGLIMQNDLLRLNLLL